MKLLLSLLLLISISASAQTFDISMQGDSDVIKLHLADYNDQVKTGQAFMITGAAIMLASPLVLLVKSEDKYTYAGWVGTIGGAFSITGFIHMMDSHRHLRKINGKAH